MLFSNNSTPPTVINPVEKFAKTGISEFKRALEVVLSEMGIEGMVPGVYDLFGEFLFIVKKEQDKAKDWLKKGV